VVVALLSFSVIYLYELILSNLVLFPLLIGQSLNCILLQPAKEDLINILESSY
jgi:hypothetical protein